MNGPSKVCTLVTTKNKVYKDPIGVKDGLWPLRSPQRKFGIFSVQGVQKNMSRLLYSVSVTLQEGLFHVQTTET